MKPNIDSGFTYVFDDESNTLLSFGCDEVFLGKDCFLAKRRSLEMKVDYGLRGLRWFSDFESAKKSVLEYAKDELGYSDPSLVAVSDYEWELSDSEE